MKEQNNNDKHYRLYERLVNSTLGSGGSLTSALNHLVSSENMKLSEISVKRLEDELIGIPCEAIDKINCIYRDPSENIREYTFYEGFSPTHVTQISVSVNVDS